MAFRRVALALVGLLLACGSRTGLLGEVDSFPEGGADAGDEDVTVLPDVIAIDADGGAFDASDEDAIFASCVARSCNEQGFECGMNGDGCGNAISCGACPPLQVCGAAQYSKCAVPPPCKPKTCQDLNFNCGSAGDGCGNALSCGFCQYPDSCGAKGTPGQCGNSLPCTNLCQQQVVCEAGTTTVTGKVVAGTQNNPDPIYNALVYVPNGAVKAFTAGVSCDHCGAEVSGEPLLATKTAADGTFTLTNMPVGNNIPLVIQLGRWRRQITIPSVPACQTTALQSSLTRMPRNKSEGDIPKIAIATGNADALECVLLKMGIDQAEFTQPNGSGRVHMYRANGANAGNGTPPMSSLVSSPNTLAQYDIVALPCEAQPIPKQAQDQLNLVNYANAGGRLFITHYGYEWLYNAPQFSSTASFNLSVMGLGSTTGVIDTSFAGGQALSTWMSTAGALNGPNQFAIVDPRFNINSVNKPSEKFVDDLNNQKLPLQYAFYTPVGQQPNQQCGRVVYSTFHVVSGMTNGQTFPNECSNQPMTPQEKNLEFMLFDVANCIPTVSANCTPRSCQDQKIECGPAGDGCGNSLNCGACTMPATCGGVEPFKCGVPDAGTCTPKTCQDLGFNCGANGDGCGSVIQCGTCNFPQTCGGGGQPGVCGGP